MAQRTINIGTGPNTRDGDTVRNAFDKVNQNFSELYTAVGQTTDGFIVTDIKGSVFGEDSTAIIDAINNTISATHINAVSANIVENVITPTLVTNTVAYSNGVYTSASSTDVPANTPTVIWASSDENIASAKLVIQAEGSVSPDANGTATWHTQICEAHVVKRANFTTTPALSVYGITYTSVSALATFTTQYNLLTNKMEVIATASNAGYPLNIKVFATEIVTSS